MAATPTLETRPAILIVAGEQSDLPERLLFLSDEGFQLDRVADSENALRTVLEHAADAILLEVQSSSPATQDRLEFCHQLRTLPDSEDLPLIIITGDNTTHDSPIDASEAFHLGACDFIRRPFDDSELLARLRHHIKQSQRTKQLQKTSGAQAISSHLHNHSIPATSDVLKHHQAFIDAVLNNVTDCIIACDENGILALFNQAARKVHGIDQQCLPPEQWAETYDLYHSDGTTLLTKEEVPLYRALNGDVVREEELVIIPKSGDKCILLVSGQPMYDPQGKKIGAVVSMHDITHRKRIEEALRAAIELNRQADYKTSDELIQFCLDEAQRLTASKMGFFHWVSPDQQTIQLHTWSKTTFKYCGIDNLASIEYDIGRAGVWADCLREKRPIIHNDYENLPNKKGLPEGHAPVQREATVLIKVLDQIIGIMGVGNADHAYDQIDIDIMELLVESTWTQIQRKKAEESLQHAYNELEDRVQRRTCELEESNRQLREEIEVRRQTQEALQQSEIFTRGLLDGTKESLVLLDQQGTILAINDTAAQRLDSSPSEMIGINIYDILPEDLARSRKAFAEEVIRTGIPGLLEDERDGIAFRCHIQPFPGNQKNNIGIAVFAMDITEQRRIEDDLRTSEARLRQIIDLVPHMIFVKDIEGRMVLVNRYMAESLNMTVEQLTGKFHRDVHPDPIEVARMLADDQTVIRSGKRLDIPEEPYQISKDNIRWLQTTKIPFIAEDGATTLMAGIAVDITERRQTEAMLRESQEQLTKALEELKQHSDNLEEIVAKRTAELQDKNRSLQQTLNELQNTQSQLVQAEKMAMLGRLASGIAHEVNNPLSAIASTSSSMRNSIQQFVEHGHLFAALLQGETGELIKMAFDAAISGTDISLPTRRQRELRNKLQSTFEEYQVEESWSVADLLVELNLYNDPLRFLPLAQHPEGIEILQRVRDLARIWRGTHVIELATRRSAKIVFALNSYAHQGSAEEMRPLHLNNSIESVLMLYRNQTKNRIDVVLQFEQVPMVECNPDEISQVWTNLIHNALQAMNYSGQLTISIMQDDEQTVLVNISDTGQGIPEEIAENIFEPFFTTKPRGEGVGLGLDIVHQIVNRHHGHISFESTPGKGTTFSVRLPIKQPSPASQ